MADKTRHNYTCLVCMSRCDFLNVNLTECSVTTPTDDNTRWAEDRLLFIFVIKTLNLLLSETGVYFLILFNVSFRY
jgi:hypothetical protein